MPLPSPSTAPRLRILDDAACARIYHATLECLERTGVRLLHAEGRALLAAAGARVDGERVRIPAASSKTRWLLRRTVSPSTGETPTPRHALRVESGQVYFGPGPTCTYFMDPHTGERRRPCRGDAAVVARVCGALPNIDYVMGLGLLDDVPARLAPVYEFAELIANTVKPVLAWAYGPDNLEAIYRLAARRLAPTRPSWPRIPALRCSPTCCRRSRIPPRTRPTSYGPPSTTCR